MLPFLQFLIILAVIIAFAKLGGYASMRLGQPAVAGEVLAGLILGPTAIDLLHWPVFTEAHIGETLHYLAELGVLLLLFIAGLEIQVSDLRRSGRAAVYAGVLGFLTPLILGTLAATWFGFELQQSLFIGLLLSPTSVSISAQTLMELDALRTRVGVSLLGAAVIDDTLVVLGISFFLAVIGSGGATFEGAGLVWLIIRMALYLAAAGVVGYWLVPPLSRWAERLPISQGVVAFAFVIMSIYAFTAEYLGGVATIIGAFMAGLALARTSAKEEILDGFSKIAYAIFVPVFFVGVGLEADLFTLTPENLGLLFGLVLIAVFSKILGSGLGGLLARFNPRESLQLGMSMVPRGEVTLIVATVGTAEGFINQAELSVTVALVVITTLLTPPVLRVLFRSRPPTATNFSGS